MYHSCMGLLFCSDPSYLQSSCHTHTPSGAKSRLKIDNVCTNSAKLLLRSDSTVLVYWVIKSSLSVFWTSGPFVSFFSTNTFRLSDTSEQEMKEEAVEQLNDSPWPVFDLNLFWQDLSKWFSLCQWWHVFTISVHCTI